MIIANLIYFTLSCIALIISGIYLVKSLEKIAKFLRISEFSAAFIIIAIASSIPELFVGISSATIGNPGLSLGNLIGASIIDLTLVTGIIIIINKEIKIKTKKIGNDVYFMLITILSMIILFMIGNSLSRIDGAILIGLFLIHSFKLLKKRKRYKKVRIQDGKGTISRFSYLLIFLLALVGLMLSSNLVVKSASNLATDLNIPYFMIGLFLLSIATTLPELVFGISATSLKHKDMALGNQIGAVVVHFTLILGLVALIHPITTESASFLISSIFMFISAFIFVTFLKTGSKLEKIEGISLILIYILFITIEFFVK